MGVGAQTSFTRTFRLNRSLRGFRKILAPRYIMCNTSQRVGALLSRQEPTCPNIVNDGVGITRPSAVGFLDLELMFRNLALAESAPGPDWEDSLRTRRLLLHNCKIQYRMKNNTTVPIMVTLYDIISRRDVPINSPDAEANPITAWLEGMNDQNVPTSGTSNASIDFPGATPFQSEQFVNYFVVKRSRKFMLHAGSEHIHHVALTYNKIFSRSLTRFQENMRGLTYYLMIVVQGGVVQDTSTPFGTAYSTAALDIVTEARWKFQAVEKSFTNYQQYTTLPTAVTVQGTVFEDTDTIGASGTV